MASRAPTRERLDPEVFRLPVERIRQGYYSDAYFNLTRDLLVDLGRHPRVTIQAFQKQHSVLGGIDEAIAVLKLCVEDWSGLEVQALHEADEIEPWEPVLQIDGDYSCSPTSRPSTSACLSRRTRIMRNVRRVVEAANGKPILFFPARHDHWLVQTGDGWAAHVAGAIGVSTDAQASWWGGRGIGTVPHGLIAAFGGDTVAAAQAWADRYADEMNVTVLVDFENDSVRTALEVADALGERLWGVRLDTSELMVDRSLWPRMGDLKPTGVNQELVTAGARGARRRRPPARAHRGLRRLRRGEDRARSSGTARRSTRTASARRWCRARTTSRPTSCGSTGSDCAKAGRRFRTNPRLERVV